MARVNDNYLKLQSRYLFSEIGKRTKDFAEKHPKAPIIKLGIGDTTRPLPPAIIKAFHDAVDEMAATETYKGYGPEQGYDFLREAIAKNDFVARGADITPDEIFISDGSKCDTGNILEIFGPNKIAISDPSYPVYVDTNVMAGNTGPIMENGQYEGLVYLPCKPDDDWSPPLPKEHVDLIYLVSPNNPTGTAIRKQQLEAWVNYALDNKAIIFFDAAYERYVTDKDVPRSIYEIKGARECAIEFRSFSKTAGFTGVRCAFAVIPRSLKGYDGKGNPVAIHDLWNRRHTTKFNGVSYPVQKAAAAVYSADGARQVDEIIAYYKQNAALIRDSFAKAGFACYGGVNSPYVWIKTPGKLSSWDFFDVMLSKLNIVGTPGSGFGPSGEGYFRFTGFNTREKTKEAVDRIAQFNWSAL
ncbi:MAG: LL-diaminopimelate aminotransferase [Candidatus Sigynarchaeota archaeon]